jgi:hypothetical protein
LWARSIWRLARAQISAFPVPIFGKERSYYAKDLEISNNSGLTAQMEGICRQGLDDCEGNGYGGLLMIVSPTYSDVLKIKLQLSKKLDKVIGGTIWRIVPLLIAEW